MTAISNKPPGEARLDPEVFENRKAFISPGTLHSLISFLTGIHQNYNSMIGGPIFNMVKGAFDQTGLRSEGRCHNLLDDPNLGSGQYKGFALKMITLLQDSRKGAGLEEIQRRLVVRHQYSQLGVILHENPKLSKAIAAVIHKPPQIECAIISIIDDKRIYAYMIFVVTFLIANGFASAIIMGKLGPLFKIGLPFVLPPWIFSVNLYIFYLFYQAEIDPIIKTFNSYYRL